MTHDALRTTGDPGNWETGQQAAGERLSGARDQLAQGASQARDGLVSGFGRALDAVEGQVHRAPADLQPHARKAIGFARERPLLTMAGLAFAALFLTRGARR
ncbi:MAG TPA: hypothetical protein VF559_12565 [Caulobacteraceae bacterium]